jgi:hypothetical protein
MPRPIVLQQQIRDSLRTLKQLRIAFRGPFVTPRKNCIYIVGRHLVTANEIAALAKRGGSFPPSDWGAVEVATEDQP